ncbi:hypothetical protein N7495_000460 [Penicillium taxi]|uniref:uncharacterized protein n=1 Tax=Penicillium taxi TaxID=168475 RepID=UPI0025456367|nr:uncharacterized protein N7495_000460 [Penicillium taxi]KAJ5907778.1 hypothetical protein N7495_000460 [Penicillium taxi]
MAMESMVRVSKGVGVVPAAAANLHLTRPTNRERVRNTNQEAHALLKDISSGQNFNPKVTSFLKSVEELTKDLLLTPMNDWQDELGALRRDIQGIKAAIEQPSKQIVESFAKMAAKAPAPAHFLSSQSSGSEPARPMEVARDREVVVCLGDRAQNSIFRRLTLAELTKRANQARAKAATNSRDPVSALAIVMILASRQLRSGDLRFTMRNVKEAEIMRIHRDKWAKGLCKTAFVHLLIWGIIVHDVNVRSLGIDKATDDLRLVQDQIIKEMLAANVHNWGGEKDGSEITKISWLKIPAGKKSGSLIVEFVSPIIANEAIARGVLWDCDRL